MRGQRYVWDGETWVAVEAERSAAQNGGISNSSKCWPMTSLALSVHRKQVGEARARAKRHGINVEYNERGHCIIPDRQERSKLLRLEGLHDNLGGYGD